MKKTACNKSLFLLCAAACIIGGCANSETEIERRNQESTSINGASYASAEENEANLFGQASSGLSSNPKSKPSSDKLGNSGIFNNLVVTAVPVKTESLINEMFEVTVSYEDYDVYDPEKPEDNVVNKKAEKEAQFVIVLERPDGANGALVVDTGILANKTEWPLTETEAVVKAKAKSFSFIMSTGNAYNNNGKPMYYINIWQADLDEPVAVEVQVRKPAQIGDEGIVAGSKKIENDASKPADSFFSAAGESKLSTAVLTNVDSLNQQLYADLRRSLSVQLSGTCEVLMGDEPQTYEGGSEDCSLADEPICVTFVEDQSMMKKPNDGSLYGVMNEAEGTDYTPDDKGKVTACGVTDDKGIFTAEINTGHAYDARYYVNFFHPQVNAPVTFQIDTFALPESLGEPGSVAAIIDEGLKLDLSSAEIDPDTGKPTLGGDASQELLDGLFPDALDADGNPIPLLQDDGGNTFTVAAYDKEDNAIDANGDKIQFIQGENGVYVVGGYDAENNALAPDGSTYYLDGNGNVIAAAGFDGDGHPVDQDGNIIVLGPDGKQYSYATVEDDGTLLDKDGNPIKDSNGDVLTTSNTTSLERDDLSTVGKDSDKVKNLDKSTAEGLVMTDSEGNPITAKEPTELYASVMEQCMVDGKFMCEASQNEDGSWTFYKVTYHDTFDSETGEPKDCNPMYDDNCGYKSKTLEEVKVDLNGDGKKDESMNVVVTTDDEGNSYFGGFDTDGDGVTDVAADPCLLTPAKQEELGLKCVSGANRWYKFMCKGEGVSEYAECSKYEAPMNSTLDVQVQLQPAPGFAYSDDKTKVVRLDGNDVNGDTSFRGQSFFGKIVRDSVAPGNNAKFKEADGDEMHGFIENDSGEFSYDFWTGTAYGSLYYISARNDHTSSKNIPISVYNSISLPLSEGDGPDESALQPGGEAMTPPGNMDPYDPNLGPVTIEISPDIVDTVSSPVVKTLKFKVVVKKDNDTRTLVSNTKTFWKITRGKALSNNGSLSAGVATTDKKGVAENSFYTGTGYDSTYYISVFHPNANEVDASGNKVPKPVVFTVVTTQNTGNVPGYNPNEPPAMPEGDSVDSDGNVCEYDEDGNLSIFSQCNTDSLVTVNGEETYSKYPQGPGCDNNICVLAEEKAKCNADGGPSCCGNSTCTSDGKQGCLEIRVVGEDKQVAEIGSTHDIKVKLVWKNGEEETPVRGKVVWTLDKGENGDGELPGGVSVYRSGLNSNGEASLPFKTGSKVTTYRINAMFPNIHDQAGNMIPKSIVVSVKDKSQIPQVNSDKNTITTTVNTSNVSKIAGSFSSVDYYILSSLQHDCSEGFVFAEELDRKKSCEDDTVLRSGGKNGKVCDLVSREKAKKFVATRNMESWNDKFTIYAVANDANGKAAAYGCVNNKVFGAAITPACEESEKTANGKCPTQRTLSAEIPLSEMPLLMASNYNTKTILNIGPLMKEGSKLYSAIDKVFTTSQDFVDNTGKISEQVLNFLTQYLIFTGQDDMTSKEMKNCVTFATGKLSFLKSCYKDGEPFSSPSTCKDAVDTFTNYKDGGYCTDPAKATSDPTCLRLKNVASTYTDCNCFCHTMFYYTNVNKLGSFLAPLVKKGLKALLDKYLSSETIEGKVCDVLDSIQFITFNGTLKEMKREQAKVTGKAAYTGVELPILDSSVSLDNYLSNLSESAVQGRWDTGLITNGKELTFGNYNIHFTYGELFFALIMAKAFNLEDDKLNALISGDGFNLAASILSCDKLGSLSVPGINFDLGGFAQSICGMAVDGLNSLFQNYVVNFALSKTVQLSTKMTGEAILDRGGDCVGTGGCTAQVIKNGTWKGSGTLGSDVADGKTEDTTLTGLWVAWTDGVDEKMVPELTDGDDDLETWKNANSICHKMIREKKANKVGDASNKYCLLDTFDNMSARSSNNACMKDNCSDSASVVVCNKNGSFNTAYSTKSGADIIKAANSLCKEHYKNNKYDDGYADCEKNTEIVNNGSGVSNAYCYGDDQANHCGDEICKNNTSIFVCKEDGSKLTKVELVKFCTDCEAKNNCNTYLNEAGDQVIAEKYDEATNGCFTKKAQDVCLGLCTDPYCVMNTDEGYVCKNDADAEEVVEEELIAEWSKFDYYLKDGKANADTTKKLAEDREDGIKVNMINLGTKIGEDHGAVLTFVCDDAVALKMVAGKDGALGALGTAAIEGGSNGSECKFKIEVSGIEGYTATKVEFNVYGDERKIKYGKFSTGLNGSAEELVTDATDWKSISVEVGSNDWAIYIWPTTQDDMSTDPNDYKVMRIDDIKVWGTKSTADAK